MIFRSVYSLEKFYPLDESSDEDGSTNVDELIRTKDKSIFTQFGF